MPAIQFHIEHYGKAVSDWEIKNEIKNIFKRDPQLHPATGYRYSSFLAFELFRLEVLKGNAGNQPFSVFIDGRKIDAEELMSPGANFPEQYVIYDQTMEEINVRKGEYNAGLMSIHSEVTLTNGEKATVFEVAQLVAKAHDHDKSKGAHMIKALLKNIVEGISLPLAKEAVEAAMKAHEEDMVPA